VNKTLEKKSKADIIIKKVLAEELEKHPGFTGYIKFNILTGGVTSYEATTYTKLKQNQINIVAV